MLHLQKQCFGEISCVCMEDTCDLSQTQCLQCSSNSGRLNSVNHYNINPQKKGKSLASKSELLPLFKENLSCPALYSDISA
jgi:hypothetical protein